MGESETGYQVDKLCRCKLWMHPCCAHPLPESDNDAVVCTDCLKKEEEKLEEEHVTIGPVLLQGDESDPHFQVPGAKWSYAKQKFLEIIYCFVGILIRCYKVPDMRDLLSREVLDGDSSSETFREYDLLRAIMVVQSWHIPETMGTTPTHFERSMLSWQPQGIWGHDGKLPFTLLHLHKVLTVKSLGEEFPRKELDWCIETIITGTFPNDEEGLRKAFEAIKTADPTIFLDEEARQRLAEDARLAEEARKAEEDEKSRLAEDARKAEEEEKTRAEEARKAEEDEKSRLAEDARKAEEEEKTRLAEETRQAEEARHRLAEMLV